MNSSDLERCERIERERALTCAREAQRVYAEDRGTRFGEIVRAVFGHTELQSYVESARLADLVALSGKAAVPIYPVCSERVFKLAYGYSPREFAELAEAGHVLPLIQRPLNYVGLDFLDPILKLNPPSYFIRGGLVYAILFGADLDYVVKDTHRVCCDEFERLRAKAREQQAIRLAFNHPECWEPYQRPGILPTRQRRENVLESFTFKYAHACCFLGEDVVREVLDMPIKKALALLTHVHMRLDHPICHGLVCPEHAVHNRNQYVKRTFGLTDAFRKMETWLPFPELSCRVPLKPSAKMLDKLREDPAYARAVEKLRQVQLTETGIEQLRDTIGTAYCEMDDKLQSLDTASRNAKWYLSCANYLAGVGAAAIGRPAAATAFGITAVALHLPDGLIDAITRALKRRIRERFLTLLWHIECPPARTF